jgi:prepilin-type N-terminal cleavage/methylation domain-containing protein
MKALSRQEGFTLIELLVGMALSLVVLGATLTILSVYTRQSSTNGQVNDAQNRARLAIDRVVWDLRNIASPISTPKLLERATPYDIVFQTVGGQQLQTVSGQPVGNTSGDERVRFCVPPDSASGTSGQEVMYSETQTWNTATPPADPWSSDPAVTLPCPDTTLPTGVNSKIVLASAIVNRAPGQTNPPPVFSYNNGALDNNLVAISDLPQVSSVQVDLLVNPILRQPTRMSELRSDAFLRNQTHAPVSTFTWTAQGGGSVLLNGATSYSPDGYSLSYSWSCISSGCPAAATLAASTDGLVSWQPGAGTYTVQLTVTDPNGLSKTSDPQQVTVTP